MDEPRNQAFTAAGTRMGDKTVAFGMEGMLDTPRVFDGRLGRELRTGGVSSRA